MQTYLKGSICNLCQWSIFETNEKSKYLNILFFIVYLPTLPTTTIKLQKGESLKVLQGH